MDQLLDFHPDWLHWITMFLPMTGNQRKGAGGTRKKREKNKHTQKKGKEALLNIDCSVLGGWNEKSDHISMFFFGQTWNKKNTATRNLPRETSELRCPSIILIPWPDLNTQLRALKWLVRISSCVLSIFQAFYLLPESWWTWNLFRKWKKSIESMFTFLPCVEL